MQKIMTLDDLKKMKVGLPGEYYCHLERYFSQLHEALGNDVPVEKFSLQQHGYIVVLCKDDDPHNLSPVGLPEGLPNSMPEFVEKLNLGDLSVYQVNILYDNDYMMSFFSEVGIYDPEVERWLAERAEESTAWDHSPDQDIPF